MNVEKESSENQESICPMHEECAENICVPWCRYEYIGIAGCTKYLERYRQTSSMLSEYGCASAKWHFDFPSPFNDVLYRHVKRARGMLNKPPDFYLALNHYYNIKTAYLMGCERALFMEDDIAFLKDKKLLSEIMSTVPNDSDIELYDWRPRYCEKSNDLSSRERIGGHWADARGIEVLYFSMVGMSRRAMGWLVDRIDRGAFGDGMRDIDAYFKPGISDSLKTYVAFPHAAMQINTGAAVHAMTKPYRGIVDEEDYFLRGDAIWRKDNRSLKLDETKDIDAVFVIGTGTANGNEELRFALRNLDENCGFIRNVYICGECPDWVDKSAVTHLPWPDRFKHAKDANIIDKLRHACETPGISKRILFCSDDQFQTRKCTFEDFTPRYFRRYERTDTYYENRHRIWHTRLRKTLEREFFRRKELGLDTESIYYYQPHIWMPIDRDKFIEYAEWSDYENRDDTIIASGYYNYIFEHGRQDFDHVFLSSKSTSIPAETHVAYNDGCYEAAMRILKRKFPSECKFELRSNKTSFLDVKDDRSRQLNLVGQEGDTSPATPEEQRRIIDAISSIKKDRSLMCLLPEVSKAEEMRIYRVRGWRVVWNDIISRCNHKSSVPSPSSELSSRIIRAYDSDPKNMRTETFNKKTLGKQVNISASSARKDIAIALRRR